MKNKPVTDFVNNLAEQINPVGMNRTECLKNELCVFCSSPVVFEDFEDDLSRREYEISGLCNKCQKEVFG